MADMATQNFGNEQKHDFPVFNHGNLRVPMVNSPLIRPYFLGGGGIGGVPLDSHDLNVDPNM